MDELAALPPGGKVDLAVTNGSINLRIPQTTFAGFPAAVVRGSTVLADLSLASATRSPGTVTGTSGSGDGIIWSRAVNGAMAIQEI